MSKNMKEDGGIHSRESNKFRENSKESEKTGMLLENPIQSKKIPENPKEYVKIERI